MKLIAFMLSVYIIALSYFPCGDCDSCDHDIVNTEICADTHKENHTQEVCSPFCMCACCLGFEVSPNTSFVKTFFSYKENKYTVYNSHFTNHSLFDIWQPPKTV